ncbi:MAG TPA: TlpA disulfide reductase family protein [Tepidisphaeraceae bacterium]|jgi:thiol-disulfide isomerase/thioredoxin
MQITRQTVHGVLLAVAAALTLILIAMLVSRPPRDSDEPAAVLVGHPAPPLTAPLLDGGAFSVQSLKGKIVVLDFWATWCPPCVESMPETIQIANRYAAQGVELYAVNISDTPEVTRQFLDKQRLNVPVVMAANVDVLSTYHTVYIPQIVVIDAAGKVQGVTNNVSKLHEWLPATIERAIKSGQAS